APLPLRRHQPARLSGDPGREPARRLHGRARQPRGRRALCRARSADPLLSATTSATLELNGAAPAPAGARPRTVAVRWALAVAHFARRKPLGAIGGMIVLAMLVMAVFAEQIAPYRYDETVRGARMTPPSAAHWLGTDNLSRDMWSRIVYGARVSVTVRFATIALAIVVATAIGVSSADFGAPPPYPSWGAMLSGSGRTYMLRAPWMAIWPGVAISLAVFGFNMLGDALRDVLDPRLRGGR